jgi:hypothetical protein
LLAVDHADGGGVWGTSPASPVDWSINSRSSNGSVSSTLTA